MPKLPEMHGPASRGTKHETPSIGTPRMTGRRLQKRNARLKRRNPVCVECLKAGVIREAQEMDHIQPLRDHGPDHEKNIQGLCKECHRAKSARENAERRNGK